MGVIQQLLVAFDNGCTIPIINQPSFTNLEIDPTNAAVVFTVSTDGFLYTTKDADAAVKGDAWIGDCANTEYECRLIQNSGDVLTASAGLNTWLACNVTRQWSYTQTVVGAKTGNFTVSIRRTGDDTLIRSDTFTMTATVDA